MTGEKLLLRIAQLDRLSAAERRLADLFEKDPPQVAFMNLVEIAGRADVGTATVTRFVRKLGYAGFAAFMKALRGELAETLDSPILEYIRATRWEGASTASAAVLRTHFEGAIGNLNRSLESVSPEMFEKAVELLADTRRQVYVTGGGATQALALYFTTLAQYFRDDVRLLEPNVGSLGQQMAGVRPHAVLLCIAYHRYSKVSVRLMELFQRFGGTVILLTDRFVSPLNRLADVSLAVHAESGAGMFSSRASGMAVLEAVLAALMPRRQEAIPGRVERMEAVFSAIDAFAWPEACAGGPAGNRPGAGGTDDGGTEEETPPSGERKG